jgi:hypothetical protein
MIGLAIFGASCLGIGLLLPVLIRHWRAARAPRPSALHLSCRTTMVRPDGQPAQFDDVFGNWCRMTRETRFVK